MEKIDQVRKINRFFRRQLVQEAILMRRVTTWPERVSHTDCLLVARKEKYGNYTVEKLESILRVIKLHHQGGTGGSYGPPDVVSRRCSHPGRCSSPECTT